MKTLAYTALYREWRPKNFEDVVGQEHITTTLKNQIQMIELLMLIFFVELEEQEKLLLQKLWQRL